MLYKRNLTVLSAFYGKEVYTDKFVTHIKRTTKRKVDMGKIKVIGASVPVICLREEDYIVAYCPPLDLSSYGKTEDEAKKAFEEAFDIFIEETTRKGSLEKVLIKLGWILSKVNYEPPTYSEAELHKLYGARRPLNITTKHVRLPSVTAVV